jgi:NAD(P)-dependent dehydrogenase (short-subunit alcohol dehydrogenase family)
MSAQGKRALVIGGETAVGRAIAVGLAEAGADVAIASLTKDTQAEFTINSALNEVWAIGRRGVALAIDAADAVQVSDAIARAEAELGGIDAVIAVGDVRLAREHITIVADAPPDEALREVLARLR